jgi:hypothetical protein
VKIAGERKPPQQNSVVLFSPYAEAQDQAEEDALFWRKTYLQILRATRSDMCV